MLEISDQMQLTFISPFEKGIHVSSQLYISSR